MDAEATETEDVQKIKIVFLGDRSVGKTSIIKRFTRDEFTERQNVSPVAMQPTIGIEYLFKTLCYRGRNYRLELWDTAGQEKYRSLVRNYLRDTDCVLFVHDVNGMPGCYSEPQSYNHLVDWLTTFEESKQSEPVSIVVGNKIDLRQEDFSRDGIDLQFIADRELKQLERFEHIEVSAKDGTNIHELFEKVLAQMQRKIAVRMPAVRLHEEQAKQPQGRCCL